MRSIGFSLSCTDKENPPECVINMHTIYYCLPRKCIELKSNTSEYCIHLLMYNSSMNTRRTNIYFRLFKITSNSRILVQVRIEACDIGNGKVMSIRIR